MTSLRQRIRKDKISCKPWKRYRGEIGLLCVSGRCLFSNKGLPWDIIEIELRSEGWLQDDENLWEILSTEQGLKRTMSGDVDDGIPDDETWTDEDYIYFYENLKD